MRIAICLVVPWMLAAQLRFDLQQMPGDNCTAKAINQLAEVISSCKLPLLSNQLRFWDGVVSQALTGTSAQGCVTAGTGGLNNARQRIQSQAYLSNCSIGGTSSICTCNFSTTPDPSCKRTATCGCCQAMFASRPRCLAPTISWASITLCSRSFAMAANGTVMTGPPDAKSAFQFRSMNPR